MPIVSFLHFIILRMCVLESENAQYFFILIKFLITNYTKKRLPCLQWFVNSLHRRRFTAAFTSPPVSIRAECRETKEAITQHTIKVGINTHQPPLCIVQICQHVPSFPGHSTSSIWSLTNMEPGKAWEWGKSNVQATRVRACNSNRSP